MLKLAVGWGKVEKLLPKVEMLLVAFLLDELAEGSHHIRPDPEVPGLSWREPRSVKTSALPLVILMPGWFRIGLRRVVFGECHSSKNRVVSLSDHYGD